MINYFFCEFTKQGSDMSDIYAPALSETEIQLVAEEKILKHGDDAFAEAENEISTLNARGEFSRAGSWMLVCQRIRKLQSLNYDALGDDPGGAHYRDL